MLNLKLAEAYIDLMFNTGVFDAKLAGVQAKLNALPSQVNIGINLNTSIADLRLHALMSTIQATQAAAQRGVVMQVSANTGAIHAQLNLVMQHLASLQNRFNMGAGGGMGGGGGRRWPLALSGFTQGLGLPFAMSGGMMAGQLAGMGLRGTVGTAIDLEAKFADLRRITGATAEEMARFKQAILGLSVRQAGVTTGDLTQIAEVGARAGVADREGVAGLGDFVAQMARVKNVLSDVPTEQLSNDMVRLLNVFQKGTDHVASLGSALVRMDNVSTATAEDILQIAQGLSGTAHSVGMTIPQLLAFASVVKDVGLTNQLAAGSFSQIFRRMAFDISGFAETLGVSESTLRDAYRRGPLEALKIVIDKFNEIGDTVSGQEMLADLGLQGVRAAGSLQQLASKFGDIEARARSAAEETASLTALQEGEAIKGETTRAALVKLMNSLTDLADVIGSVATPAIKSLANALTGMVASVTSDLRNVKGNVLANNLVGSIAIATGQEGLLGMTRDQIFQDMIDAKLKDFMAQAAQPIAGMGGMARPMAAKPAPKDPETAEGFRAAIDALDPIKNMMQIADLQAKFEKAANGLVKGLDMAKFWGGKAMDEAEVAKEMRAKGMRRWAPRASEDDEDRILEGGGRRRKKADLNALVDEMLGPEKKKKEDRTQSAIFDSGTAFMEALQRQIFSNQKDAIPQKQLDTLEKINRGVDELNKAERENAMRMFNGLA